MRKKNVEKKKKHTILKTIIFIILFSVVICFYSRYIEIKNIKMHEYNIESNDLPWSFDGVKVVHFSDLNYGSTIFKEELTNIVENINDVSPDLVLFTGNLISPEYSYTKEDMEFIISTLKNIDVMVGKYAVKGVHDNKIKDYDINISDAGFKLLENEYDLIYYKGFIPIYITGLSSYLTTRIDLDKAFSYYDKTEDELKEEENIYEPVYKIVMINESDAIDEILEKDNTVNLILTGNSLGGTVKLPFVGPLFKEDGSKKYSDSYYKVNNTEIYVSNGLGTNSTKMRLFNNPSFNLYRLKSNN